MQYELTTILPLQTENKIQETIGKIEEIIKNAGGVVKENQSLVRGRLSYPIKNQKQGEYYLFKFESDSDKLEEIRKNLKLSPAIIRFEITKALKIPVAVKEPAPPAPRGWTKRTEPATAEIKKEGTEREQPTLEELDKKLDKILKEEI